MKRRKNKKILLILVLLLGISIGYAALATTLKINGNTGIKNATWSVYWDNVQVTEGSVSADDDHKARITDTAKTLVEYSVVLSEPGDFYEFTVDAVNNGTIDAMIDEDGIVNGVYTDSTYETKLTTIPKALKYTVTYADGSEIEEKHLLAKKSGSNPTKETYKVRVEYSEDVDSGDLGDTDQAFYFKFSVKYVQADGTAVDKNASAIHYVSRQNEGQITPGDVIGIGETEDFYVISTNSEKTVLLAKYNLKVGLINSHSSLKIMKTTDSGYGLQSVDAIAGYTEGKETYGGVAFSSTNYWDDGGLLNTYAKDLNGNSASYSGNPYPYVYNNTYASDPNLDDSCLFSGECFMDAPGYSLAYYVELYKSNLIGMGAPSSITGRILSGEEVERLESMNVNGKSVIYNNQSYWIGTVDDETNVKTVDFESDSISWGSYDNYSFYGVRPVIEISTSEIE